MWRLQRHIKLHSLSMCSQLLVCWVKQQNLYSEDWLKMYLSMEQITFWFWIVVLTLQQTIYAKL